MSTDPRLPALDFATLRQEGVRLLERLASPGWTDFNAHDPGITILEQLCYALTDLAYRCDFEVKDLLAGGAGIGGLPGPEEALTCSPVTAADLRRAVIDLDDVKNAWVEPAEAQPAVYYDPGDDTLYLEKGPQRRPVVLRGLSRVVVEAEDDKQASNTAGEVAARVSRRLQESRGLCEDFAAAAVLRPLAVRVRARVEVGPVDDPDRLLTDVYEVLAGYVAPRPRFRGLAEALASERGIDEVLNGPGLRHGWLSDAELAARERKEALRASDLVQLIMDVEGVRGVHDLRLEAGDQKADWYLDLGQDRGAAPYLDVEGSDVRLVRGQVTGATDPARVLTLFQERQLAAREPAPRSELAAPAGRDRRVGRYLSIQHHLPEAYGVGPVGLPGPATPERQAQARQLKAYLAIFDQLLANAFAQLAGVRTLFSAEQEPPVSYFAQVLNDPRLGLEEVRTLGGRAHAARLRAITEEPEGTGGGEEARRRSRFLNHLLARFAEDFTDYTLALGRSSGVGPADGAGGSSEVAARSAFLKEYAVLGHDRGRACDATGKTPWEVSNVSGLARRVAGKLGLLPYRPRPLAGVPESDGGGFHLWEHILLRPGPADDDRRRPAAALGLSRGLLAQPVREDPYSAQVSFLFPDWVARFQPVEARSLIGAILRREAPAHLVVHLAWLNREQMALWEAAQEDWAAGEPETVKRRDARDRMIVLLGLGSPFPLRDLRLTYPAQVPLGLPAEVRIRAGQAGVRYQLCDEDGNPLPGLPDAVGGKEGAVLRTPPVTRDVTCTVRATRKTRDGRGEVEAYLNEVVAVRVGLDTGLAVSFEGGAATVAVDFGYSGGRRVVVQRGQEGVSYELVEESAGGRTVSAAAVPGKGLGQPTVIELPLANEKEDRLLRVRAFRTADPGGEKKLLDAALRVNVRPNPAVMVTAEPAVVDFRTQAAVTLTGCQASVTYELYARRLTAADYLPQKAPGCLEVPTGGAPVLIATAERVAEWILPGSLTSEGPFPGSGDRRTHGLSLRAEDTLYIVRATKVDSKETLQLDRVAVVLVRPAPDPEVAAREAAVPAGSAGMVLVRGTQAGVSYQLQKDADGSPVGRPGFHVDDRGVGSVRVEVDLVVGEPEPAGGNREVWLPTDPVQQATTYRVLATKVLSGLTAPVKGKATIDVAK